MWTPTTRQQHSRPVTRYQTDLTDAEWRVIAPHLPKPCATGRPREWPMREIINGIFYVMRAGCARRLLPSYLPPWETIYRWFAVWRDDGRLERINHALVMADRERVGCDASPSAAIIDSQSIKTTEAGGSRGYDAGKKINGRKRHALVDADGRGLVLGCLEDIGIFRSLRWISAGIRANLTALDLVSFRAHGSRSGHPRCMGTATLY
jgi:transposase